MNPELGFHKELERAEAYGSRIRPLVELSTKIMDLWRASKAGDKNLVNKLGIAVKNSIESLTNGNGCYSSITPKIECVVDYFSRKNAVVDYAKAPDLAVQVLRAGVQFAQEQHRIREYNEKLCLDVRFFVDGRMRVLTESEEYVAGDTISFLFTESGTDKKAKMVPFNDMVNGTDYEVSIKDRVGPRAVIFNRQ